MLFANVMLVASIICFVTGFMIIVEDFFFASKFSTKKIEVIKTEAERLRGSLNDRIEEARIKDSKIERLSEQLERLNSEYKEYDGIKTEVVRLKINLSDKVEEARAKDPEIKRLNEQLKQINAKYKEYEEKLPKLKKIESDLAWIEETIGEQKKYSHEMKQRIEENKMKMQLLNGKTKENVELIASFAEGKEFDEFRKSIHLDGIIQKYENEIKGLRIKNMELEKKIADERNEEA